MLVWWSVSVWCSKPRGFLWDPPHCRCLQVWVCWQKYKLLNHSCLMWSRENKPSSPFHELNINSNEIWHCHPVGLNVTAFAYWKCHLQHNQRIKEVMISSETLTIQKSNPEAKSAYCSMVDRTLNIRHTRTMRNLWTLVGEICHHTWVYLFPFNDFNKVFKTTSLSDPHRNHSRSIFKTLWNGFDIMIPAYLNSHANNKSIHWS